MDGAILVVSAVDGPQEQTREHVILSREVGIKNIVVYLNKMDMLKDKEIIEMVNLEVLELLESYKYNDCKIVKGSARVALEESVASEIGEESIKKLMDIVDDEIDVPERDLDSPFLMPIEHIVLIKGRGVVVTGKVERGVVKIGDELEILGKIRKNVICMGLEMYRKVLTRAEAGENVGILLKNLTSDDKRRGLVKRGSILAKINSLKMSRRFRAKAFILLTEEGGRRTPFTSNYKPQFFFRTSNITGAIILDDENTIVMPGDVIEFNVVLAEEAVLEKGLHFTIREGRITVGGGIILEFYCDE